MSDFSISQAYLLANKAQIKLQREAQKPDLSLRHLLSHAHLLDNIIAHLSDVRDGTVTDGEPIADNTNSTTITNIQDYTSVYEDDSDEDTEIIAPIDSDSDSDIDDDDNSYIDYYRHKDASYTTTTGRHGEIFYNVSEVSENYQDACRHSVHDITTETVLVDSDDSDLSDNSDFSYEDYDEELDTSPHEDDGDDAEDDEEDIYEFNYVTSSDRHNFFKKISSSSSTSYKYPRLVKTGESLLDNATEDSNTTDDEIDITELSISNTSSGNYTYTPSITSNNNNNNLQYKIPKSFGTNDRIILSNQTSNATPTELNC
ncbi:hypothetical protein DASC09_014840 [Saccharomycopsis crataegensis]|uniref:Uncharacterized protein n=1 Tax=Saccharomycopsis crataegensis TaxID=43959 RepID=A0AAV5QHM3_9ASCO|nr:hypothetical protein DASC09_014840 [Saccharomycopsis crataegensis]